MKKIKKVSELIFLTSLVFLFFTSNAYAYMDPGTGSYILQIIIGMFLAGFFAIKGLWHKITNFFKK